MTVATIGLDIAKNVFQVHGVGANGQVIVRRQLRRTQVLEFFGKLSPCLVGLEACSGAHDWARQLVKLGHEVRLMPPQYVKPYVKRHKNDAADAEAICEAVTRPTMRFVAIKTEDQQAILMHHRTRELLVRQRGMLINALRAHLHELGIMAAQGGKGLNERIALVNDKTIQMIPDLAREAMILLVGQLDKLTDHLKIVEKSILSWHRNHVVSRRLASMPGVGPIIASAIAATVVDPKQFKTSRQFQDQSTVCGLAWPRAETELDGRQGTARQDQQVGRQLYPKASGHRILFADPIRTGKNASNGLAGSSA